MERLLVAHLALVAGVLLAVVLVARVVRQRRPSQSTLAWLLAIVLIPYLGIPLYLAFGGRKLRGSAGGHPPVELLHAGACPPEEAEPVDRLLRSFGLPGASPGNRVRILANGEETYRTLLDLIDGAQESLRVTLFILHPDEVGTAVLERLARRAEQGLRVQLLLDGLGSFTTHRAALEPLVAAGGRVAFFLPLLRPHWRSRANLRNHRKIVVADERRVLAGGINVASEYMGPAPRPGRWRDLAFVLEGPAVRQYAEIVRADWSFATGESIPLHPERAQPVGPGPSSRVQVIPSGPDVAGEPLLAALLQAVHTAQRRIFLVTPYFVPDEALQTALALAARRGVDVRVLLPERSNHRLADLARGAYLRELQEAGARILLYRAGMVHAKAWRVDEALAVIGSANLDLRSLYLSHEVMMFAYDPAVATDLDAFLAPLAAESREGVAPAGAARDLAEGVVRMLAPLL